MTYKILAVKIFVQDEFYLTTQPICCRKGGKVQKRPLKIRAVSGGIQTASRTKRKDCNDDVRYTDSDNLQ
jgi:hypothetical protein